MLRRDGRVIISDVDGQVEFYAWWILKISGCIGTFFLSFSYIILISSSLELSVLEMNG